MPDQKQEFIQAMLSADTKLKQYERKMEVIKEDADFTDALLLKMKEDKIRTVMPSDPDKVARQAQSRIPDVQQPSARKDPLPPVAASNPQALHPQGVTVTDEEVNEWLNIQKQNPKSMAALRAWVEQWAPAETGLKNNAK